jgi:hypothetical protein
MSHTTDDKEFSAKNLNNKVRKLLYAHRDLYGSVRGSDPDGQRIYYNPRREHLFIDEARNPVRSAECVWQIGKETWASGVVHYAPGEAPEPPPGFNSAVRMPAKG